MNKDQIREVYGAAAITSTEDVVGGTFGTWNIRYTVGQLGMNDGSMLKIALHNTSDCGSPQFEDPRGDNFCSVKTSGNAMVRARYEKGHVRPWIRTITITVSDGFLKQGETISLVLGDNDAGSMGFRAQTFTEKGFTFLVLVDPFGTGDFVRLPTHDLKFDIVPGQASTLEAIAPSIIDVGETANISIRAKDCWGNIATGYAGRLRFELPGIDADVPSTVTAENGLSHADVVLKSPGVYRLTVRDEEHGLTTTTNPLVCGHDRRYRIYWGDLHGQSEETCGTGSVGEYFEYAKEKAFLDFASHTGNDFEMTDDFWKELQARVSEFYTPGAFVTFLGYEWSANTPGGGDHNVYFLDPRAELHRSSSWLVKADFEKHRGLYPVAKLYAHYKGRDDVLIIPHQGGRPASLDVLDPGLSPLVEILSTWGVFEWFGQEALQRGYTVGFVGGSDDHTGRPGSSHRTNHFGFNFKGGLMGVLTKELTRKSLWEAFRKRRCYTTTGARILLDVAVEGHDMGEEIEVEGLPAIKVSAYGTSPIQRIDLFRGSKRIASKDLAETSDRIELIWSGARSRTYYKVEDWRGGLTLNRGKIVSIEEFGFNHPDEGIQQVTDTFVRWTGSTSGNHQGLRIALDAPDDAILSFRTPTVSRSLPLRELHGEQIIDRGHLDRKLVVRHTGVATHLDVDIEFREEDELSGTYPYYVRIRQSDGEMAWSSPIFVTIV